MSIENLLSTKPLLNLPIVNRYTPFGVIKREDITIEMMFVNRDDVFRYVSIFKIYIFY
jgi:hypothetical protein